MHIPGYFSLRDLNNNTSNSDWSSSHHQDKTFGQYHDLFFSTRPTIDYDFDKEKLRQTVLKHESIFQHQLHELHRLYNVQRDMMNEIRTTKERQAHSKSFTFRFPKENERNGWQMGCKSSIQSGLRFMDGEFFESKLQKLQKRLFDLELPADKYLDDDGDEVPEVSANTHHYSNVNHEITRDVSSQLSSRRESAMIDLNEHVLDTEYAERSHDRRIAVDLTNLHTETESSLKGSLYIENGHEKCKERSFSRISHYNDLGTPYKSPEVEHGKLYPNRTEPCVKKKIFGVEIPEVSSSSNKCLKILGFPIFNNLCEPHDLRSSSSPSESSSPVTVLLDGAKSCKVELLNTNPTHDPMLPKPGEKQSFNGFSGSKLFIDLNKCVEEEEAQITPSSTRNNSREVEIDLEVPASVETETAKRGSLGKKWSNESLDRPQDSEDNNKLINLAAEALFSISIHNMHDLQGNAMSQTSEASGIDPLHWFATVISSQDIRSVSTDKDSACDEDIIADGMDYFEYMTLELPETKVEDYNNSHNHRDTENMESENMTRRLPWRCKARRGRKQRKDFQRDVLPSLTCLSRNEVICDLQTIEGLIKEAGGKWQLGLTRKSMGKSGSRRGRKRSCGGGRSGSDRTADAAADPPAFSIHRGCRESGLEERSLTGWGKRTRRPPRQKCMVNFVI